MELKPSSDFSVLLASPRGEGTPAHIFKMLRKSVHGFMALLVAAASHASDHPSPVTWHAWSPEIFAQAKRENKFILLDLEAVWCHWCHVMEETTYRDADVDRLMASRYLAVRVDQDARPDLANRYEDYGWPATILYAPDGSELVKRQGYIPPRDMASLLQAVIDDPTPGPSVRAAPVLAAATGTSLGEDRTTSLLRAWTEGYDMRAGGWGFSHKYLDWDCVELAMRRASRGDEAAERMAKDTLRLQRGLLDPVWGGVYQYSVGGEWTEPHFEKIMQMQAENLRIYAQAYARWRDPADLEMARAILRYLRNFLTSPDGVVFTSQDADLVPGEHSADYYALDDRGRRARGIPRIDTHVYARENGWVIVALCELSAATGEAAPRAEAERAAKWVLAHLALRGGGFHHDEHDEGGPYLGDTLAMGRAFLALHELTQDHAWLEHATAAAKFIEEHFSRGANAGFASSDMTLKAFPEPLPQFDENVAASRWLTRLAEVTGRADYRAQAASALRWLLAPGRAEGRGFYVAGVLLAEPEARTDPVHVVIVGRRDDAVARAMLAEALKIPDAHRLVEWWDRREGPAPRGEDIYPALERPAAFVCANGACSSPMNDAAALAARLAKLK
ncbi:MAG: hypothetical protein JWM35_930 [Verrucomicrobia bacterium]|nr:hypothetical protein [Verrucomicrobiota bacterium]